MATFASRDRDPRTLYRLLIGAVVPRPIALVSTRTADGAPNLAPFSFFNGVCYDPPTVAFTVTDRRRERKDTAANLEAHPACIVHIVDEALAEAMNRTSGEYGAHVDEFREAGLTPVPGSAVEVPRVAEAAVALECRVAHHLRVGRAPREASHVLAEVVHWHVRDDLLDGPDRIDPDALRAIGRMGGAEYARTRDRFAMARPVVTPEDLRAPAAAPRAAGAARSRGE